MKQINGFSKLTKAEKIQWLCDTYFPEVENAAAFFEKYHNPDAELQKRHDEFIENTITNYYLPFAVAPNFLINGRTYTVPMGWQLPAVRRSSGRVGEASILRCSLPKKQDTYTSFSTVKKRI